MTRPKHFSLRVLLQLFAITISIFVLAVLFWKLGRFFRHFTQAKVTQRGNATTARYARTWYGWVPAERHVGLKKFVRVCFDKFGRWTAWRSSNQDYSWVWWDPGQRELNKYRKTRRPLQWLPRWVRSYSFTTADTIWNPRPADNAGVVAAPSSSRPSPSFRMAGALSSCHTLKRVVGNWHTVSRTSICAQVSIKVYLQDGCRGAVTPSEAPARAWDGLEWLSNQLIPGRRPYHFALLANHWLNPETWIVIDPPTRISIDARRRLGDPRFNDPYPAVDWTPKPKYPKLQRRTANVPKINSWRAAVNRNRRAGGLDDIIKGVELFEGSDDAPPDGKVDPACWILRKPPQGFSMSSRQGTVFYEGGAGWQETLDDWQKVRRGYRIRKAIHEGRANRRRAKEIALGITRYYRLGISKIS
ncbi:hypothetical protein BO86DRAFT_408786 [Aspergillus japonicus CBS 114.51]|uniref:Uncharacterized protein n=1 Tax=Aspergillus japonicus CBS 114.51 TaxID=1448312 RepID=A0A8T8X536_ASPJA|nr:hypothetical protein BO86DRAFT_408786 [Aspergillus japonicus CBS 114.51]RAH83267.1 hypothetical protein BO86DRAFT_408786 [Aspergillus japonicus CBS 114.51]